LGSSPRRCSLRCFSPDDTRASTPSPRAIPSSRRSSRAPSSDSSVNSLDYPLDLRFRLISLGPQINVVDAGARSVAYVKQKAFRLKEDVEVHTDESRRTPLWRIKADRIIDWSAAYRITDASGALLGTLRRKGGRSLWRATYVITDPNDQPIGGIHEKDPWTKVLDGLLSLVPIVGDLTGYVASTFARGVPYVQFPTTLQTIIFQSGTYSTQNIGVHYSGGSIGFIGDTGVIIISAQTPEPGSFAIVGLSIMALWSFKLVCSSSTFPWLRR